MRTQEVRQNGAFAQSEAQEGTSFLQPPQFQLAASPVEAAPVLQRQVNPPTQQGEAGTEGAEGGETQLGQSVGPQQQPTVTHDTPPPPPTVDPWEEFALAFSEHFRPILPNFDPTLHVDRHDPQPAAPGQSAPRRQGRGNRRGGRRRGNARPAAPAAESPTPTADTANANTSQPAAVAATPAPYSGPRISAEYASTHFSVFLRTELMAYMRTHMIPARLFSGGDVGSLDEGQRISISAHILANGRFRRGNVDQRVHGRHCGNWAQIVLQYAGLGGRVGSQGGTDVSFDFMGNLLTSNARITDRTAGHVRNPSALPQTEEESIGPLEGGQLGAYCDAQRAEGNGGNSSCQGVPAGGHGHDASTRFGRMPQLDWATVMTMEPGDWIWEYNANPDPRGMHSVIFIRWKGDAYTHRGANGATINVRRALCYSQPSPEAGGRQHDVLFGDRYDSAAGIHPVNRIARARERAAGITPEGILPNIARPRPRPERANGRRGRNRDTAPRQPDLRDNRRLTVYERNDRYIRRTERDLGLTFRRGAFMDHLRARNSERITTLSPLMSAQQRAAFVDLNATDDLDRLLQLFLRLQQLTENADIWDQRVQNQVNGTPDTPGHRGHVGLNAQHAAWERREAERRAHPAPRRRGRNQPAQRPDHEPFRSAQVTAGRDSRSQVHVDGTLQSTFPRPGFDAFFGEPEAAAAAPQQQGGTAQPGAEGQSATQPPAADGQQPVQPGQQPADVVPIHP